MGGTRNVYKVLFRERQDQNGNLGVVGNVILKWIFDKMSALI
jgi:hypothetical protein